MAAIAAIGVFAVGCAEVHTTGSDASLARDMGTPDTDPPDTGSPRDLGPPEATWDAGPWPDGGSCGAIELYVVSDWEPDFMLELLPGVAFPPRTARVHARVTEANVPAIEAALGVHCQFSFDRDLDGIHWCYIGVRSWDAALSDEDYARLCQVRDQLPVEGIGIYIIGE